VGKPEIRRLLGRPRRRRIDNIKMDLGERGCDGVNWMGLTQDIDKWSALVNAAINFRIPSNAGKLSRGYTTGGAQLP
jgi:hypothetical protein